MGSDWDGWIGCDASGAERKRSGVKRGNELNWVTVKGGYMLGETHYDWNDYMGNVSYSDSITLQLLRYV